MGDDGPTSGRSEHGMRRGDDGVWFDTRTGAPVGPDDAWWVKGLWATWELPLPPSVRRQIGGPDDDDGAGDRVPRLPLTPLPTLSALPDLPD